jgi:hypothetical protein
MVPRHRENFRIRLEVSKYSLGRIDQGSLGRLNINIDLAKLRAVFGLVKTIGESKAKALVTIFEEEER